DLQMANFESARRGFEDAMVLDRAVGQWLKLARDLLGLGQAHLFSGDYETALGPLERSLAMARDLGDQLTVAAANIHLGLCLAMVRDPLEGLDMVEDGYRQAVRAGLREAEIGADLHLLRIALVQHDDEMASAALRRCKMHRARSRTPLFDRIFGELETRAGPFLQ
ncbi:MAG: tetratricopeptide repeat protein, partial [Myxococcota bacterium]